jgi:excisionase family DNA binding protein
VTEKKSFLTVKDVAGSLGVSPQRVYQLVGAGEIPSTRLGGAIRIPRAAWEKWLETHAERALASVVR